MYFPTMPHDELYENATVSKVGRMYSKEYFVLHSYFMVCTVCTYLAECINGHPFAVTEVSIKQNCN